MDSRKHSLSIEDRLDRLESKEAIRQLAVRYALAVDMRDLDALVNLYVDDVRVSETQRGRRALKKVFGSVLRVFTATVHHIGGHVIEFDDPDTAHGIVYTRAEHELGDQWVTLYAYYLDIYKRIDSIWYFKRRALSELYSTAAGDPPIGEKKIRWPGATARAGTWHDHFPSWQEFWNNPSLDNTDVRPAHTPEGFLDDMRRGDRTVRKPDFSWTAEVKEQASSRQ
jgi:ketosteroid isomerase-like protein